MGFAVPMADWLRGDLCDPLHAALHDGGLESLGLNMDQVQQLFDEHQSERIDHVHRLFGLLQLALWCRWREQRPVPTPALGHD